MNEIKEFTELEIIKEACVSKPEYCEENVPYFCTHSEKHSGYSGYGRIIKTTAGFVLVDIGLDKEKDSNYTSVQNDNSLEVLVDRWNVKRVKGKVILFVGDKDE